MATSHMSTCFFFRNRPPEELQDPNRSPGREEVGRRTLRDYGGFLLPVFYRDRFHHQTDRQSSRIHFPPLRSKGGKSILEKWSRESGKEKGPGQLKRMLRIYPTYYGDQLTRLYSRKKVRKIGKNR